MSRPGPAPELDEARRHLREGRLAEGEALFARLLEREPDHVEALNVAALAALRTGQPQRALPLLDRALAVDPAQVAAYHYRGTAREQCGDAAGARQDYEQALALDAGRDHTRLLLGRVLERLGEPHAAALSYLRALRSAQSQGRWLNPRTTPESLRPVVEQAIRHIGLVEAETFARVLEPVRAAYGRQSLERVEAAMRCFRGVERAQYPDPRQRPTLLYLPGLAPRPYFDTAALPFVAGLEAQTGAIRDELQRALASTDGREAVFHDAKVEHANLKGGQPQWNGYYFYRHGRRNDTNAANSPRTLAAVDALPLPRIRGNAPEVLFSVLAPDTHLLPHRGVTNTRLVLHLPLIVPPDCALRVGGEQHEWQEGRCVVFDDTYEHEAWNRSTQTRVVLIADLWHPELTDAERAAFTELAPAIGELRREAA